MFYFKITVRTKGEGGKRRTSRDYFREYMRPEYLGQDVASFAAKRVTSALTVTKISQAAYVRATRGGE